MRNLGINKFIIALIVFIVSSFLSVPASANVTYTTTKDAVIFNLKDCKLKIDILSEDVFRIQYAKDTFKPSVLADFGFVKTAYPKVKFQVKQRGSVLFVRTNKCVLELNTQTEALKLLSTQGETLIQSFSKSSADNFNTLHFSMDNDEHFFGFGFMRKSLDVRGTALRWKRDFRWSEATVPFFMSTNGYGFYSANTYDHNFDFTEKNTSGQNGNSYSISNSGNSLDFYIFHGPDFKRILDQYTNLTGRPWMVPKWALGTQFRTRYLENQQGVLATAAKFRERNIPIDVIALEPGWEEVPYSMNWQWSKERFPNPTQMISKLSKMGFKFDLWESGVAPFKNLSDTAVRNAWFKQRVPAIKAGVQMFKQDDPYPRSIESVELEDGRSTTRGIQDDKYPAKALKNISNSLYTETYYEQYKKLTGKRSVMTLNAYNASVSSHRWPFQWAADFQSSYGMINASLSGHALVAFDIRNPFPSGWHQGFLSPITIINSWAYYREPWRYTPSMEQSHRFYASLRSRLMPYLYTSLWQSHSSGLPVQRPMVLGLSRDTVTHKLNSQYYLGDWLLVGLSEIDDNNRSAPKESDFSNTGKLGVRECKIYLPKGVWIDYWTGREYKCDNSVWIKAAWPDYAGGPLFVKQGAIIPMGQVKNFIGEKPDEVVVFDIYPDKKSSYDLYEDDGTTYNYEKGAFALTRIETRKKDKEVLVKIGARKGGYENMPQNRSYLLKVHALHKPSKIVVNNTTLTYSTPQALLFSDETFGWFYDNINKKAVIKVEKGWRYVTGTQTSNPAATIPLTSDDEVISWTSGFKSRAKDWAVKISYDDSAISSEVSFAENTPATSINAAKGRIVAQTNPPEVVNLPSGANWLPKRISVYGYIEDNGNRISNASNKIVLKVFDKDRVLLKSYEVNAHKGEFVFKDIPYEKRPEKYYFQLSSENLEGMEIKIFDNTWDK